MKIVHNDKSELCCSWIQMSQKWRDHHHYPNTLPLTLRKTHCMSRPRSAAAQPVKSSTLSRKLQLRVCWHLHSRPSYPAGSDATPLSSNASCLPGQELYTSHYSTITRCLQVTKIRNDGGAQIKKGGVVDLWCGLFAGTQWSFCGFEMPEVSNMQVYLLVIVSAIIEIFIQ